ncbi:hypothetical protein EU799_02390 [Corynebacterium silvaticum]|uniref:Uncharacterized protein n=1 Tax=Corynebacterium silvaticum TaxID=2320431 RepID=A0A7U5HME2_9CORY|nr:hypothetical protein EU802_00740 [Corynebacterium silvaticum]TFA97229.1 hypothetical protein EU799_02390 [Corynebacterium silvaticum]TNX85531.1 hypothetical protein FIT55_00740 [Corynebacterium silvaticum]TRM17906.1 hypothetical protein ET810_001730 [Corynebacterium silvaticum]
MGNEAGNFLHKIHTGSEKCCVAAALSHHKQVALGASTSFWTSQKRSTAYHTAYDERDTLCR